MTQNPSILVRKARERRRRRGGLPALTAILAIAVGGCGGGEATGRPVVVDLDPPNGAIDVDPARTTLTVTFDREMDREGWSWVQESPESAPKIVGNPTFDASGRVNRARVELEPGRTYVLWINSAQYDYFRDTAGTPAEPLRWTFTTRRRPVLLEPFATTPSVVALEPPDGATDVDPATGSLRVTFDRPMRASWSWVMESPETFPETLGEPVFESEGRVNVLKVRLQPATRYVIWLNSDRHRLFQGRDGTPLPPLRWSFTTRAAH